MAAKRKSQAKPPARGGRADGKKLPPNSRRCTGKNKAGERCKAPRIKKGTVVRGHEFSGMFCRSHEPDISDSARLQQSRPGIAGGPRSERSLRREMRQKLEQRLSAEFDKLSDEIFNIAQHATRAVVVPGTRDEPGYVEIVPDEALKLKGIDSLFDRVLGKATATNEIILPGGETDTPPEPPSRERLGQVADILQKAGAIGDGATPTRSRKKDV